MARQWKGVAVGRAALLWVTILWLALGVGGWLAPFSAEAASLKSLQSAVTAVPSSTAVAVTLSPSVDATKAFVVCSARTTSDNSNRRVTCVLSNTTLTIDGGTNVGATVSVSWYVAEFAGGVTVQRGTGAFAAGSTVPSPLPSLTAVDCTKSFVVLAGEQTNAANSTANDEQFTFRAILATTSGGTTPCTSGTSSNLTLTRSVGTNAATMAWQVVTYEGASVQRGIATITQAATTATAAISVVDTSKSFVLMSRMAGTAAAGIEGQYQTRAAFTSTTQLTFTRAAQNNIANRTVLLSWEVVSLSDGSTVQPGTTAGTGTHTTMATAGLTALDLTRTVTFFTASGGDATTATFLNETSWTVVLTTPSTSTITFTRGTSATLVSTASWFVVSFFKCAAVSDASFVTANGQSGQATVYWPSSTALIGRKTAAFVSTDVPVNGNTYAVSDAIGTATVVDNQSVAASSFNQTGLDTSGATTYSYKVFPKTTSATPTPVSCYAPGTAPGVEVKVTPKGGAGSPNWSYATGATTLVPPGLTDGGVVVSGSNDSKLHGMSASVGTQSFAPFVTGLAIQARPPVIPSSLSRTGLNIAYVTSQDGKVYAIDTAVGSPSVWTSAFLPGVGGVLQGGAAVWLQTIKTLPFPGKGFTTVPDMVVVGTNNLTDHLTNKVYGLHGGGASPGIMGQGGAIWTFSPVNMDIITSTPYIDYANNAIWVTSRSAGGTGQPSVWKLNASNGTLLGSLNLGDIDGSPSSSLDGSFIYVGTNAGDLKAINAIGAPGVVATHTPASGAGAIKGFPVPFSFSTPSGGTPDTIVFSRDATVHSVSFNGTSFGTNWTTTNFPSAPVASVSAPIDNFDGTNVYVGASDGKVHELVLSTGTDGKQVTIVPVTTTVGDPSFDITLGRVYVGAVDGHIYSFTSPF